MERMGLVGLILVVVVLGVSCGSDDEGGGAAATVISATISPTTAPSSGESGGGPKPDWCKDIIDDFHAVGLDLSDRGESLADNICQWDRFHRIVRETAEYPLEDYVNPLAGEWVEIDGMGDGVGFMLADGSTVRWIWDGDIYVLGVCDLADRWPDCPTKAGELALLVDSRIRSG